MKNTKRNKNNTPTPPFPKGAGGIHFPKGAGGIHFPKGAGGIHFPKGAGGIHDRYLPYNKNLKQLSRNLRNNSTQSEIILWKELRAAKLGYTFNRQKPLLDYIVDFYCKPLHLIIELDGLSHWELMQLEKDEKRQAELESLGLHFLRFDDNEVYKDLENVVRSIALTIEELEISYPLAKRRKKIDT